MFKNRYRYGLAILLAVVCVLLYFAADKAFTKNNAEKSVLAGENGTLNTINEREAQLYSGETDSADAKTEESSVHMVIPCGEPIGIYVKTEGVMVINTGKIETKRGVVNSPCDSILKQGDYIVRIDENEIEDKNDLIHVVEESQGKELTLSVVRDGKEIQVNVVPLANKEGHYMLGLWVKDDISGIGTLTYVDEQGFGALGHSINDNDTGAIFTISDGAIYEANLVNIVKADGSNPGRLEGMIDYSADHMIGRVEGNTEFGITGYITKNGTKQLKSNEWIPVARREEAHLGDAYLLSSVSGQPEYYRIEITGVDISRGSGSKGLEIKVTDERLLSVTSGIVQGMSGTPIIQDGKLLGAVTHVFLKDSTKGYGAFVESMMYGND